MIERFMRYYQACHCVKQSLRLQIDHGKIMDWGITIYHGDSETFIFDEHGSSLNVLCAKAYIALEEWASGYMELEDIENNL